MKPLVKNLLILLVAFFVLGTLLSLWNGSQKPAQQISFNQLASEVKDGKIDKIAINKDELDITLKDKTKQATTKETGQPLTELLTNFNIS